MPSDMSFRRLCFHVITNYHCACTAFLVHFWADYPYLKHRQCAHFIMAGDGIARGGFSSFF